MRLFYYCFLLPCALVAAFACVVAGQDSDKSIETKTAQSDFDVAITRWRSLTKIAGEAGLKFYSGSRGDSDANREVWKQAVLAGEQHRSVVEHAAMKLMQQSTTPSRELTTLLLQMHESESLKSHWHRANKIAETIRPFINDNSAIGDEKFRESFLTNDAIAAISANDFDRAKKFLDQHGSWVQNMPSRQFGLIAELDLLIENYRREQELIAKDAAGEPLPRVVLKTTKGKIELELFENQAPDTVGNFVHLVEQGFYTNLTFHRVIANFMAQTGGLGLDNRTREPPYAIFDEYQSPDARKHFQGYLSMANAGVPDSGAAQFFITLCPQPGLDGKHTVFGRVISGFDTLESINLTHSVSNEVNENEIPGVSLDYIISASVTQKRNHEYKPRTTQVIGQ